MSPITLLLFIVLLTLFYKIFDYHRKLKSLGSIPGPSPLPLIGNILDYAVPREKLLEKVFINRHKRHGPIFVSWFGSQPVIHLSQPQYAEVLLSSPKYIKKGYVYKFLLPWLGSGLLTSEGRKWFIHRKLITPTFHFKILETFLDVFNEAADILVSKLNIISQEKDFFDVYPYVTRCALDIICETAMGTKIHAQKDDKSVFVSSTYKICELILNRQLTFWQHSDLLFDMSKHGKEFKKNLKILHEFTENVIRERRTARLQSKTQKTEENLFIGLKNRKAFLDLLLDTAETEEVYLSDSEIREEVDTFMFEGHDTTTAAISWALLLLGSHLDIQDAVRSELTQIFENDPDRKPTMRDLNEMKYLERVIKETLRLYPSVGLVSRTLEKDLQLGKYLIPKDTALVVNIFVMHRDEALWPNPGKFDPDRFLPDIAQKRHPYAFIPFSAGPRNCIGQKFALMEEKVVLSAILRKFRVESLHKKEDVVPVNELIIRPLDGIFVRLTKI